MRMTRLVVLAFLVAPCVAAAADLPVTYTVQEKALKEVVIGTSLSFELYSDNACTTFVQSVPVNVENVSLLTKLKQLTPKGDAKLPNTVELRTTLAGVTLATSLYLKITGSGVVPIGGACQAQVSAVAGSGSPGAGALLVKDANGTTLCTFMGGVTGSSNPMQCFRKTSASRMGEIGVSLNAISSATGSCLSFSAVGCVGDRYVQVGPNDVGLPTSALQGNTLYLATGARAALTLESSDCGGGCQNVQHSGSFEPVEGEDISGFVPPFRVQ